MGYTHSMLTSLPCGQRTVGGFSDGVTFWRFWEIARVGRRLGSSSRPASLCGRVLALGAVFEWGIGRLRVSDEVAFWGFGRLPGLDAGLVH